MLLLYLYVYCVIKCFIVISHVYVILICLTFVIFMGLRHVLGQSRPAGLYYHYYHYHYQTNNIVSISLYLCVYIYIYIHRGRERERERAPWTLNPKPRWPAWWRRARGWPAWWRGGCLMIISHIIDNCHYYYYIIIILSSLLLLSFFFFFRHGDVGVAFGNHSEERVWYNNDDSNGDNTSSSNNNSIIIQLTIVITIVILRSLADYKHAFDSSTCLVTIFRPAADHNSGISMLRASVAHDMIGISISTHPFEQAFAQSSTATDSIIRWSWTGCINIHNFLRHSECNLETWLGLQGFDHQMIMDRSHEFPSTLRLQPGSTIGAPRKAAASHDDCPLCRLAAEEALELVGVDPLGLRTAIVITIICICTYTWV